MRRLFLLLACLAFFTAAGSALGWSGWSTVQLKWINMLGDKYRNYDFVSTDDNPYNVDWAVDFLYVDHAAVEKVQGDEHGFYPSTCASNVYAHLNDGAQGHGTVWFGTRGMKQACAACLGDNAHQRLYADTDGLSYNAWLGYYVFATSHFDHNEGCSGGWSGKSETAERSSFLPSAGVTYGAPDVIYDLLDHHNFEANVKLCHPGGDCHWWQNDGLVTWVDIPSGPP